MKPKLLFASACFFLFSAASVTAQKDTGTGSFVSIQYREKENLNVLDQWIRWNNPGSLLINHLLNQAGEYYKIRDKEIARLETSDDWTKRQEHVRIKLNKIVGPFPERTPLNPLITGIVRKKGFRVEKLIYEAMPESYVTGCLFVPDVIDSKAPAVLNVIGHNQEAFRAELYQIVILNLVKKGIVVLAIDPPGQGEHLQYFDPEINFSRIGYSVIEHSYLGNQCFLTGSSAAMYFTWEGIRGIDYLLSLDYVDPERIGVTGFSGGGTVASYIAAFDERVKVSVPCSWATASRRQLETKGAQDAETEFYRGVAEGITFEDLLEVRAPKPTLLTFVSRDEYLSLQGAREALAEAQRAYDAFGLSENIQMVEDDYRHWLTPKIREAIYSFFMKHFGIQGDCTETETKLLSVNELTVTPTGQVTTYLGGKTIFDANKKIAASLNDNLVISRRNPEMHLEQIKARAQEISGYTKPSEIPVAFINGRYQRDGYTVEKLAIRGEGDYVIPFLLFIPDYQSEKSPALIYLHPEGKITEAHEGGAAEKLVKSGFVVAAADVLGNGETTNTATRNMAPGYTSVLTGKSIVGIQAGDIARVARYLTGRTGVDPDRIGAAGIDEMCLPLIHAAALEPAIKGVVLIGSPISYRSVAMNRYYKLGMTEREGGGVHHPYEIDFSWGVAGVLTGYDLPDLIGSLAPRRVAFIGLKDQMLESAPASLINQELEFPRTVYSSKNAAENIRVIQEGTEYLPLVKWCLSPD